MAAEILRDTAQCEGIDRDQVALHSDNGGPMKGATMLATLQALGIIPSFSRPAVSNDNSRSIQCQVDRNERTTSLLTVTYIHHEEDDCNYGNRE